MQTSTYHRQVNQTNPTPPHPAVWTNLDPFCPHITLAAVRARTTQLRLQINPSDRGVRQRRPEICRLSDHCRPGQGHPAPSAAPQPEGAGGATCPERWAEELLIQGWTIWLQVLVFRWSESFNIRAGRLVRNALKVLLLAWACRDSWMSEVWSVCVETACPSGEQFTVIRTSFIVP